MSAGTRPGWRLCCLQEAEAGMLRASLPPCRLPVLNLQVPEGSRCVAGAPSSTGDRDGAAKSPGVVEQCLGTNITQKLTSCPGQRETIPSFP